MSLRYQDVSISQAPLNTNPNPCTTSSRPHRSWGSVAAAQRRAERGHVSNNMKNELKLQGHHRVRALILVGSTQEAPYGFTAKVADFGLSKQKRETYVSGVSSQRGTLPWIAPEIALYAGRREPAARAADLPLLAHHRRQRSRRGSAGPRRGRRTAGAQARRVVPLHLRVSAFDAERHHGGQLSHDGRARSRLRGHDPDLLARLARDEADAELTGAPLSPHDVHLPPSS